jgi:hypothetical protein
MAVWREGTTGALTDNAVDVLDNARALPTCQGSNNSKPSL